MEAAVGERTTEALVEEQEEERDVNAFGREAVSVAAAIALQQAVSFELAQIVAELVEAIGFRGELERGDDCPRESVWPSSRRQCCRYAAGLREDGWSGCHGF